MPSHLLKLAPVLLAGVLVAAGLILRGPPLDPDVLMGHEHLLGTFLLFLGWALCAFSWGSYLARKSGMDDIGLGILAPSVVLGPVFLSLLVYVLGILGLIGYALSPLHLALLFAGPILFARQGHLSFRTGSPREPWRWPEILIAGMIAYSVLSRLVWASLANGTTDPFMYHLLGPRLWSEVGSIQLWPRWGAVSHASYWEHLFVLGNSLLGGKGGQGLIEGQFFGQWVHLFFGLGGTLAVSYALQRLLGISRAWALAGTLAVSVSKAQIGYAGLAKNDYGIESWVLFAVALLLAPKARKLSLQMFAGVLIGMSLLGKVITVLSIAPWAVVWVIAELRRPDRREAFRTCSLVGLGVFAGALPILARNFWFTHNPFFPLFPSWFPDQDWITGPSRRFVDAALAFPFRDFKGFMKEFEQALWDTPFMMLSVLVIPFALKGWSTRNQGGLSLGGILGVLLYCALDLPNAFLRWVAPSLGALQFGGLAPLEVVSKRLVKGPASLALLALLPASVLVYQVDDPRGAWGSLVHGASPTLVWRMPRVNNGGDSKAWLRLNAKPGETIASLGETGFYPVYHLTPFSILQHPVLDPLIRGCLNARCLVKVLRAYHVKYVYDVAHWAQRYYSPMAAWIDEAADLVPSAIVYAGVDSHVIDVAALEDGLLNACPADGPAGNDFLVP